MGGIFTNKPVILRGSSQTFLPHLHSWNSWLAAATEEKNADKNPHQKVQNSFCRGGGHGDLVVGAGLGPWEMKTNTKPEESEGFEFRPMLVPMKGCSLLWRVTTLV